MKKDIHPAYYENAKVTCACGNTFMVGSTLKEIRVELCNLCHPFYTGKQKFVDTARRVEKYQEKVAKVAKAASGHLGKKAKHAAKAIKKIAKTSGTKEKK
ncbi:MAG: 50S ribosomal protein L31 [Candidatus Magasanikbacteria bacterium RIFCSPLOWO2_01_FULL_43_20b]|uniref:Large ribosomal subunit protein bL31 n=1 Tax=Candidatus Magasanikbacteria bacterium RIFCSPLOWO2_12_FULL_43_12 TaxID=1798692 RepID=A0A1F6MRF0_9BACT|nr:MAG: 50S ribosomal protein L31 [Candidatus Magasanikbacteria bacterium RIFCSPHIGHO2_02_FULL_44_13]OGH72540.1 MAG: 50S ribosomal protein L31 [Candidatus Magasanikbacteria bacterium RIFCSPLOWO2_02_FULL_43_22]OGH73550.1 MAG: 50S ribosomal protein L31 [Candidatus Magasanikbacteria bacterium RIFCSPLOWO2_01_FULL_43_20b]OGH74245.1 MAG: 50S ribosomal protein L31 [Candidatus Magasanikbacteria bacterium RIFCSPLOWO2_12_FULL_43_12]